MIEERNLPTNNQTVLRVGIDTMTKLCPLSLQVCASLPKKLDRKMRCRERCPFLLAHSVRQSLPLNCYVSPKTVKEVLRPYERSIPTPGLVMADFIIIVMTRNCKSLVQLGGSTQCLIYF